MDRVRLSAADDTADHPSAAAIGGRNRSFSHGDAKTQRSETEPWPGRQPACARRRLPAQGLATLRGLDLRSSSRPLLERWPIPFGGIRRGPERGRCSSNMLRVFVALCENGLPELAFRQRVLGTSRATGGTRVCFPETEFLTRRRKDAKVGSGTLGRRRTACGRRRLPAQGLATLRGRTLLQDRCWSDGRAREREADAPATCSVPSWLCVRKRFEALVGFSANASWGQAAPPVRGHPSAAAWRPLRLALRTTATES
jgi:hypothetical protein